MAAGADQAGLTTPAMRGAHVESDGVRFRVFSSCADRVQLCLHDSTGPERERLEMQAIGDGDWEAFVPGCHAGQHYGYRVHGPWDPEQGWRCNPAKLLLDPYARQWAGAFHWSAEVFDYNSESADAGWRIDRRDSASAVPRSVVTAPLLPPPRREAIRAWNASIVYETNVRGFTMGHPGLDETERGKLRGLTNGQILDYLKALGITTVELMPAHAFVDERHLVEQGLRNLWGYNTVGFFAVEPRLAGPEPISEFRSMVTALHEAGFDVLLDVVYNHTGEGGGTGPTLSFRGLDNLAYYRVDPEEPERYVNDAGTGNTVNVDHPVVQRLVLDSLRYWHGTMGVDGFRFDIAPVLGNDGERFNPEHPLLQAMGRDPALVQARLIAEPWGPVGYELGRFPTRWSEWNDRYRDAVRKFWRRGKADLASLARRLHGSADLFDVPGRGPGASVNFVTAHDGFTLADLVSYSRRHNEANGEGNRDGHRHNYAVNHGAEGPTDRGVVLALRRRHRLNLLATLMFSQGVPMLLAGDELGNSQGGNNNAYAQDNPTGWLDWSGLEDDPGFLAEVRRLVWLRREHPLLWQADYLHGHYSTGVGDPDIDWYHPAGRPMTDEDWTDGMAVLKLLTGPVGSGDFGDGAHRLALAVNGHDHEVDFSLPATASWQLAYATDGAPGGVTGPVYRAAAWSVALLTSV